LYGIIAKDINAQGIFIAALASGQMIRNSAFINVSIKKKPSVFTSQINRPTHHLLFHGITMDQTLFLRAPQYVESSFIGNIFSAVALDLNQTTPAAVAAIDWKHNHFVDVTSYGTYQFGTGVTTGTAQVVNWSLGDFRPLSNSNLVSRVPAPIMSADVLLEPRPEAGAVGAYEVAVD
jgi:hypothetical protein